MYTYTIYIQIYAYFNIDVDIYVYSNTRETSKRAPSYCSVAGMYTRAIYIHIYAP